MYDTKLTEYKKVLRPCSVPSAAAGGWQLATTILLFFALWFIAARLAAVSYGLTLILCVPTAGLLLRLFVIQHDCGHRALFRSRRANDWAGIALSSLTWTPYHRWRREHAVHHATSGDLDRRGFGDLYLLTVREYLDMPPWKRFTYRFYRNPLFLFTLGPLLHFVVLQRLPLVPRSWRKERLSVHWTNGLVVASVVLMAYPVGLRLYLLVHLPVSAIAASFGVFLFYIQHFFDGTYWRRRGEWDFLRSGLEGSSYLHLPRVLDWFSASIGYHHIHHLCSSIPNYRLRRSHLLHPDFAKARTLTLRESLACLTLHLWDEESLRMVSFRKAYT